MSLKAFEIFAQLSLDSSKFEQGLKDSKTTAEKMGKDFTKAGKSISKVGLVVGGLEVGAVKTAATFEQSMAQVGATMGYSVDELHDSTSNASKTMQKLSDFAQEMGAKTKFSASESADALNYMALAGYDAEKSMKMLPNVLNLAAAGDMDLARASDMVTDAQTAFGMDIPRTTQMVDEMAKAASTGNTSVEQLGDAFLTVGGLAQELNGGMVTLADGTQKPVDGVQELEIALTAMANSGIKGSEAGTHMRNMLLKLSSPTSEGTKQLEALGVAVFDNEGKMRSLKDIMGDLNGALGNLTQEQKIQAISDLFNTRDLASAEALLGAVGQDWDSIGAEILDADGAAQKMADVQLDTLEGQLTILKSALEGAAIAFGKVLVPALKDAAKGLQGFFEWLGKLPEPVKEVILIIGGVIAALGPALIFIGKIATGISVVHKGMKLLKGIGLGVKIVGLIGKIGGLIAAAAPIIGIIAAIALAIAGVILVIKNWGKIVEFIKGVLSEAAAYWGEAWEGMVQLLKDVGEAIWNVIVEAWNAIVDFFVGVIESIVEFFAGAWETISTGVSEAWTAIADFFTGLWQGIWDGISAVWTAIGDFFSGLWQGLSDTASNIWTGVSNFFSNTWNTIKDTASSVWEGIGSWLSDKWSSIKDTATNVWEGMKSGIGSAWDSIKSHTSSAWSGIKSGLSSAWDGIKNGLSSFGSAFAEKWNSISEGVKDTVGNLVSSALTWGKDLVQNFVSGITGMIGKVKDAVGSVASAVKSFLGFSEPEKGPLSNFHTYAPDMIDLFTKGIYDNMRQVETASSDLAEAIRPDLTGAFDTMDADFGSVPTGVQLAGAGGVGGGDIIIPVYIGTNKLDEILIKQEQIKNYRSGGR